MRESAVDSATTAAGRLFTLGVVSSDPDFCSVVLWTRLAPDPLTLTPVESSAVETDAVLEVEDGFNKPGSGKRLAVKSARIPFA